METKYRPTTPGKAFGMNMQDVHQMNIEQQRKKGFTIGLTATTNIVTNIQLSGSAKLLLGIIVSLDVTTSQGIINLSINNDKRIENIPYPHITRDSARTTYNKEYYPVLCVLGGNDTIILEINASTAAVAYVTFYYV